MKKATCLYFVAALLLCASLLTDAYAQSDSVYFRRADSVTHFVVGSWGPFDEWPQANPDHNRFGKIGDVAPFRYYNLPDSLGMNGEVRGFWDYSNNPAPKDTILGGRRAKHINVLTIEPLQLFKAFDNAQYMRFEFERHQKQNAHNEYLGFLDHNDTGGQATLQGVNQKVAGATYPRFLVGSSRVADTTFNALVLDTAVDDAGVFADSMWNNGIYTGDERGAHAYYSKPSSRKMMLRLRIMVTDSIADPNTVLFYVYRTETTDNPATVVRRDTQLVRVNSAFANMPQDFDIITIPMNRHPDTKRIFFKFYWPKQASAVFDYMELMTAHIETTDSESDVNVGSGNWGTTEIAQGRASAYSAEDFLAPNPVELQKLVDTIIARYKNRVNYVRIGDEFPYDQGLTFKRLVKLFRDRSAFYGTSIEVAPFTVDSGTGWFGHSLPNAHVFNFEGSRLGWVDTALYADPKMIYFDPYVIVNTIPLPRRIAIDPSNTDSLFNWEVAHMTARTDTNLSGSNGITQRRIWETYNDSMYIIRTQFKAYNDYLNSNRQARRWTERQNNGSRWGILWEAGASPELVEQVNQRTSPHTPLDNYWLSFNSLRPPTGPEMKVTGHLATSCGSSALLMYLLTNPKKGASGPNGGIMTSTGAHDSMYSTVFVARETKIDPTTSIWDTAFGKVWLGTKERYDTVSRLLPILKVYGNALFNSQFIGEWRAIDLLLADSITKTKMPFFDSSVCTLDDSLRKDAYFPTLSTTDTLFQGTWPESPVRAYIGMG